MMKALYRVAKTSSEKIKHLLGIHLLQFGNLLMKIIISRFITPISYKSDKRHGLYFIMIMDMPVVVDDNYLKTLEDNNGKFRIQQSDPEAVGREQEDIARSRKKNSASNSY